jgi:hypothetical protein
MARLSHFELKALSGALLELYAPGPYTDLPARVCTTLRRCLSFDSLQLLYLPTLLLLLCHHLTVPSQCGLQRLPSFKLQQNRAASALRRARGFGTCLLHP